MLENKAPNNIPQDGDRVLWIRFWAFGDVLQSAAEAMLFKKKFPNTHLTFLTKKQYAELINEQPWCDSVISGDKAPFAEFKRTLQLIKNGRFDWIISTNHGGKTALMSKLSGVKNTVGTTPMQFLYDETLNKFFQRTEIDHNDRNTPSIFASSENIIWAQKYLSDLPNNKLIAIIGASNVERMWPLEHWKELIGTFIAYNWGIILIGSGEKEIKFAKELKKSIISPNIKDTTGKLSLTELSAVASTCKLAIGNDTGTLHLSALMGIPTIGLSDCNQYDWIGLRMPWFTGISARDNVVTHKTSHRGHSSEILSEITPEMVLLKFKNIIFLGDIN